MLLGEFLKIIVGDARGQRHRRVFVILAIQLQQQAFLQVAGGNARRVKGLDDVQHLVHLGQRHFQVLRKSQVVQDCGQFAAHIAVLVNAANNLTANQLLVFGQVFKAQLRHQRIGQVGERGNGQGAVFLVAAHFALRLVAGLVLAFHVVVHVQIVGHAIVKAVFRLVGVVVFRGIVLVKNLVLAFFQHGIYFQFLLNAGIQFSGRYLQQLDELDLLRREFLVERLRKSEFLHGGFVLARLAVLRLPLEKGRGFGFSGDTISGSGNPGNFRVEAANAGKANLEQKQTNGNTIFGRCQNNCS